MRSWLSRRTNQLLLILVVVGLLPRALLWLTYEPVLYSDSITYLEIAVNFQKGDLAEQMRPYDAYTAEDVGGYALLSFMGRGHQHYQEGFFLVQRLRENIAQARGEGDSPDLARKRETIVAHLDTLARAVAGSPLAEMGRQHTPSPENGSYLHPAEYTGHKPPVYPLFLLLLGRNLYLVWFAQSLLGILVSVMLFSIIKTQTGSEMLAFVVGLSHNLNLFQLLYEADILTETMTTFLIVLSLWLLSRVPHAASSFARTGLLVAVGSTAALAGLTRQQFLYLPLLYALFLPFIQVWGGNTLVEKGKRTLTLLAPALLLILGWSFFHLANLGYFGPATQTGYSMSNHSGGFIEYAPDEYAAIRDTYLKYRPAEAGKHPNTIWVAYPEIRQVSGLSEVELSRQLTAMSVGLFAETPLRYATSVFKAWITFWKAPFYWELEQMSPHLLADLLLLIGNGERYLMVGLHGAFLLLSLYTGITVVLRRRSFAALHLLTIAIVLGASVVQALPEFGENGRYAVPLQSLVIAAVGVALWSYISERRSGQ